MSEPWGHKVLVVVYVEGAHEVAINAVESALRDADVAFAGVMSITPVQDEPKDQVAS